MRRRFIRGARDADWDFSGKTKIRFWIQFQNPNLNGFQNPGPVLWLYSKEGTVKLQPSKDRNFMNDLPFNEARHTWAPMEIPLGGNAEWTRQTTGRPDARHVTGIGFAPRFVGQRSVYHLAGRALGGVVS